MLGPGSQEARVVAVLGMHRSGTSALAGSLQAAGLEFGEVSERNPHNLKGNRESPVLMEIHDAVLRDNGGSWLEPRYPNAWSRARQAELAGHIRQMYGRAARWGFKDPRTLLVLEEWHRQLADALRFVGIYRHPLGVSRSLAARNARVTAARAVELWVAYNERMVDEHARAPFPLLRFDVSAPELRGQIEIVVRALGLDAAEPGFFDDALVHNNDVSELPVPERCREVWTYLEAHRLRP